MRSACVTSGWTERMIRRFAGVMVLASAVLAWQVDLRWLLLTGFVGLNLLQFSFTNFCPLALVLSKFDPDKRVAPVNAPSQG